MEADLSDIREAQLPTPLFQRASVDPTEIASILEKLPGNKAPGPDRISNSFLKACKEIIAPVLANIFSGCLQIGYCPTEYKKSLTYVLRKP